MNFFSVCFRTSRAIPGKIPGQAYGNFPSPLRKGLQSFPESTPVLPEKNWSTPRKKLEYSPKRTGNGSVTTLSFPQIYLNVLLNGKAIHLQQTNTTSTIPLKIEKNQRVPILISGSSHADHHSKIKSNQICQTALSLQLQDQLAKKRIGPSEPGTSIF